MSNILVLENKDMQIQENPFKYFIAKKFFTDEYANILLKWVQGHTAWTRVIKHFYDQYEFRINKSDSLPSFVNVLVETEFLQKIRKYAEYAFKVALKDKIDVDLHKLLPGQAISIHNDHTGNPDYETHRIVVQLNNGMTVENGGILCTFKSNSIDNVDKAIRPMHNSCFGFEISKDSYHAVSPVIYGERFTLIFSMYRIIVPYVFKEKELEKVCKG
ncbi:cyclophane-containing peptide 2OG-Fe(II) oxygenase YhhC [Rickettsia endosymbiont of Polydrusus tereticollis]|uniref:cyclophane-containing peptide 2OG-Fe(II) oxygenase YhhC n=1 Tax=Rickettsia endosymbiont of Polydrusus tereticollis TaxID=3066251 RepID=UPI003132F54A